jgi:predicted permease
MWLDDLLRDLRFALRTLSKSPGFTAVAVLILALGIGVNTALFTVIRQVLLKTLPVSNPEQLVEIECNSSRGTAGGSGSCMLSYPAFRLLSDRHEGLSGVFAFSPVPNGLTASYRGRRAVVTGQLASSNIFTMLGVAPAAGRLLIDDDDRAGAPLVAVLSYGYWRRSFAENSGIDGAVGQPLILNGHPVTIVGVLPRFYRGVTFGEPYDVVLPLGQADVFRGAGALANVNSDWLTFLGRRQPGLSTVEIGQRLQPIFRHAAENMLASVPVTLREQLNLRTDGIRVDVRPAPFGAASNLRRTLEPTLRVLAIIVVVVLCIACTNLAGLLLSQTLNRQAEFGLRLALGAGRSRLLRQVVTESLLLSALGGCLGLLLAQWITPAAFTLATDDTALRAVDFAADQSTLAFTALISVGVGLAVGAASVLCVSSLNLHQALHAMRGSMSPRFTRGLLAVQIALTIPLVGGAILFLQTLTNLRHVDTGFHAERLLTVRMDPGFGSLDRMRARTYVSEAAAALRTLHGVQAVTYSNSAMGAGVGMNLLLDVPGFAGTGADAAASGVVYAGPGFVRTLGMTLLAGRDLAAMDRGDSAAVAIVNESFATYFFGTVDVVGRTFAFRGSGNRPIAITGVVKDARDGGVKRPTQRVAYTPFGQRDVHTVTFSVRIDTAVSSVAEAVHRTLERLDPGVGVERITTADAQLDQVLRRERLLATLGAAFGGLALLLLAVGLYGMLNAMVVRRTAEIGVRMALGAARSRIAWMFARETLTVLIVGAALGIAGHLAAARVVQSQLFGVQPSDFTAPGSAVTGLVLIAAVAVWAPVRRATTLDPVAALRRE